jgi:hypothetical protein
MEDEAQEVVNFLLFCPGLSHELCEDDATVTEDRFPGQHGET